MPTINLQQDVYDELQELMADELQKKLNKGDIKDNILSIVKNKYGITYSSIIREMIKTYKSKVD